MEFFIIFAFLLTSFQQASNFIMNIDQNKANHTYTNRTAGNEAGSAASPLHHPEVIIIGGSYSGMQAAMTLGRALRRVLIIDADRPCNRFAPHAHNLLGGDGISPALLREEAKKQIAAYPSIHFVDDQVTAVFKAQELFTIHTHSGQQYTSEYLVLATGLKDDLPDIPGIWECWGKSVIHCPYCHGYEFKGARTAVLASGDSDLHMISLLKQWTGQLQVFMPPPFNFSAPALAFLQAQNIGLTMGHITALHHQNGALQSITLQNDSGTSRNIPLDVLYVSPPVHQALDLRDTLGYQLTASGHIQVDEGRRTTVPGLYAVGDNSCRFRSLSQAIASGMAAGAMINFDFIQSLRPLPDIH